MIILITLCYLWLRRNYFRSEKKEQDSLFFSRLIVSLHKKSGTIIHEQEKEAITDTGTG